MTVWKDRCAWVHDFIHEVEQHPDMHRVERFAVLANDDDVASSVLPAFCRFQLQLVGIAVDHQLAGCVVWVVGRGELVVDAVRAGIMWRCQPDLVNEKRHAD